MRTDTHNNPTAFTTDIAKGAGLVLDLDYSQGDSFTVSSNGQVHTYFTAKILGDPIATTIKVIDKLGFQTPHGNPRWTYVDLPKKIWDSFTLEFKTSMIGLMYQHEGGVTMKGLFPPL